MAVQIKTAKESALSQGIKCLVHGASGAGKTVLCTTTGEKTLIISAEAGLLSIRNADVDVAEVNTIDDVTEIYQLLSAGADYQWICLDSISEIGEVLLANEKAITKDPRQAYGALIDKMGELIRAFRDLKGYNVLMTSKQERIKDEDTGSLLYMPSMPGSKLAQSLPYWFDEVFAYRVEKDPEGNIVRVLQTSRDLTHEAKDRSGALELFEEPDLSKIAAKIRGENQNNANSIINNQTNNQTNTGE